MRDVQAARLFVRGGEEVSRGRERESERAERTEKRKKPPAKQSRVGLRTVDCVWLAVSAAENALMLFRPWTSSTTYSRTTDYSNSGLLFIITPFVGSYIVFIL